MNAADAQLYADFSGLAKLKVQAGRDAQGALDQVAKQFESLLMGQMLKSMRQASLGEGILDNDKSLFYRDLFDQQLAQQLASSGGLGLAAVIKRQLADPTDAVNPLARDLDDYRSRPQQRISSPRAAAPTAPVTGDDPAKWDGGQFVQKLWPWALEAAGKLGLAPQALLAQAALETGWGAHMIRQPDGAPSNNLFGIKSGARWQGDNVEVASLEYEQGVAVQRRDRFRAYASLRDSFNDYVEFVQSNPRYERALQVTGDSHSYFSELQRAGYATDPDYADKIDALLKGPRMTQALERLKGGEEGPL